MSNTVLINFLNMFSLLFVNCFVFIVGLTIKRIEENGGDITFKTYQELEQSFADKVLI